MIFNGVEMRGLELGDAAALAEALKRNRAYMQAYEPIRPDAYYTEAGQLDRIEGMLADRDGGRLAPWLLVDTAGGEVVGAINLGSIVFGALCSGGVGYWVDTAWHGKGLASAALAELLRVAREELGLHRVEAGTLIDNKASQRVLQKAGFEEYG
ncbi:GNAT family N-acetyltransferase, partial [Streptomyces sp. NPDC059233]